MPRKFMERGPLARFEGCEARGEFYAFQVGLFACRQAIDDVAVRFTSLTNQTGGTRIPASASQCFNVNGID